MSMLQALLPVVSARAKVTGRRSPQWPRVRRLHLASHPRCAACGRTNSPEVHHLEPVQIAPERELDATNLITLCGGSRNCHLAVGHGWNWKTWRPQAAELAGTMRTTVVLRPEDVATSDTVQQAGDT